MPAASALRAEKAIAERSRGAHPCVAQLASSSSRYGTAPAILAESCRMKACASEPRAPRTLTAKVRSRKRGAPGRWGGMVYWLGARVRSRWRCAAPREVSVCWRAIEVSPAGSHVLTSKIVRFRFRVLL